MSAEGWIWAGLGTVTAIGAFIGTYDAGRSRGAREMYEKLMKQKEKSI